MTDEKRDKFYISEVVFWWLLALLAMVIVVLMFGWF